MLMFDYDDTFRKHFRSFRKPRSRLLQRLGKRVRSYSPHSPWIHFLRGRINQENLLRYTRRCYGCSITYCPFYVDTLCYILCETVFVELRNSTSRKLYTFRTGRRGIEETCLSEPHELREFRSILIFTRKRN